MEGARSPGSIRVAELISALSLATDLGLGQPLQHELGVCLRRSSSRTGSAARRMSAPTSATSRSWRTWAAPAWPVCSRSGPAATTSTSSAAPTSYRAALSAQHARAQLAEMVSHGAFDKRAVDAVLDTAGALPVDVRRGYPAGLSEREVEVLRLVARGKTSKEIARALTITEKTAGHH